ncbi:hypothetical protein JW859_04015 [bacterium]|nr:hypothetical protein [bacterium]
MADEPTNVLFVIDAPAELREHLARQLADVPELALAFADPPEEARFLELASIADVMVGWRVSPEVLAAAGRLRQYIFGGVGAQTVLKLIDAENERRRETGGNEITLLKCTANTYATAQHAVALLLALANKIIPHHNWMATGLWRRGDDYAQSVTLRGRRIGLMGYGDVNQKVHRFLAGFAVEFAALTRTPRDYAGAPTTVAGYTVEQLEAFLDAVDVLFIGVPLTSLTDGLIQREHLRRLGSQGLIVNVGRGAVVDEAGLYAALASGEIAGAALDVWYNYIPEPDAAGRSYPYAAEHPFHELGNVVLSPHRAASPVFALTRWDEVADHLRRFAAGAPPVNVVDLTREY